VWNPETALSHIQARGCTVSGGAAPLLKQVVDLGPEQTSSVKSLRLRFCGGAAGNPELVHAAARAFPQCLFFRAYGSTEMPTVGMGISSRADADMGARTDGQVLPPTEVKIAGPEGKALADGEEGEILARGPEEFAGYLRMGDNQDSFDEEGFFRTGDLGRLVNGRFILITGRKKDIIIRSGENISPKEVEDLLLTHPAVADVAVVAMPSAATGEMGCAHVILRPGHSLDLAEIRRFLDAAGLARQKIPEYLVICDELPRVPTSGKVRKDLLRARSAEIARGASSRETS